MHPTVHKEPPYPLNDGTGNRDLPPPYSPPINAQNISNPYPGAPYYAQTFVSNPQNDQFSNVPMYPQMIGPNYGSTAPNTTIIVPPQIITVGACPACRIGVLEDDYTCLGLLCAILFFPIGILCCLALKNRRCSACGAYFG
uniref:Membrane protein BRI3 n=1 Tax=Photinus pyralis TaxID=7054 RepID=A0A1Y1MED6_PHOPY